MKYLFTATLLLLSLSVQSHDMPDEAKLYFSNLSNGDVVESPLELTFGVKNLKVAPVGVDPHNSGHIHILLDVEQPPLDGPIPYDSQHIHLDNGETETQLPLSPGKHTLQLILADEEHETFYPPIMSKKLTVTVKK